MFVYLLFLIFGTLSRVIGYLIFLTVILSVWWSGANITLRNLESIANAFDVKIEDLFEFTL